MPYHFKFKLIIIDNDPSLICKIVRSPISGEYIGTILPKIEAILSDRNINYIRLEETINEINIYKTIKEKYSHKEWVLICIETYYGFFRTPSTKDKIISFFKQFFGY
jgi:hypothetical protein